MKHTSWVKTRANTIIYNNAKAVSQRKNMSSSCSARSHRSAQDALTFILLNNQHGFDMFRSIVIICNRDAIFPDMSNSLSQVYKPSQFAVQFTVIHAINIRSNIPNRSNRFCCTSWRRKANFLSSRPWESRRGFLLTRGSPAANVRWLPGPPPAPDPTNPSADSKARPWQTVSNFKRARAVTNQNESQMQIALRLAAGIRNKISNIQTYKLKT